MKVCDFRLFKPMQQNAYKDTHWRNKGWVLIAYHPIDSITWIWAIYFYPPFNFSFVKQYRTNY
jgi:hypothetical protein